MSRSCFGSRLPSGSVPATIWVRIASATSSATLGCVNWPRGAGTTTGSDGTVTGRVLQERDDPGSRIGVCSIFCIFDISRTPTVGCAQVPSSGPRAAVVTVGGTMGVKVRVGVHARRLRLGVLAALVAAVAIPFGATAASAQSDSGSAPVVKVGMITSLTGPLASNPEVKDSLLAAVAAFNKRGGRRHRKDKLQADVCDSKGERERRGRLRAPDGRRRRRGDAQRPGRSTTRPASSTSSRRPASRASASAGPTSPSSGRACRTRSPPASSPRTSAPRSASSRTATPRSASCAPMRPPARRSRASSPVVHPDRRRHHV